MTITTIGANIEGRSLHAPGIAVIFNGISDENDNWNWLEPIEVIVSSTHSVSDSATTYSSARIFTLPAHGSVSVTGPVKAGQDLLVQIVGVAGNTICTSQFTDSSDTFLYIWDGRSNSCAMVLPGIYSIAVLSGRSVYTGEAVIV